MSASSPTQPAPRRVRMTPEDRRRQLLGIGLARLVANPLDDVPVDVVAAQAGISRGLLFHYFPTKADYQREVVAAAGRRLLRNVSPARGVEGPEALRHTVTRFVEQVRRRRTFFLALVRGEGLLGPSGGAQVHDTLRTAMTDRVMTYAALPDSRRPLVHAWLAYVEDLALTATDANTPPASRASATADHALAALDALLAIPTTR
ncbi:MAG: TetR/AcrR family transcriptional regulator [Nostocoides sp.]